MGDDDGAGPIVAEVRRLALEPGGEIARDRLRSWMYSEDLAVQTAVYGLLSSSSSLFRITPPLDPDEPSAFFREFLRRALSEPQSPFGALSRHGAAWEIAAWFISLFRDASVAKEVLVQFRDWIASMYLSGSTDERRALVNGALEHLFEDPAVRDFFVGWKDDPILGKAFDDALVWVENGGDSPIVGRRAQSKPGHERP